MSKLTDNTEILDRNQAAARGIRKYWNGSPCRKGHEALRYTTTGACSACVRGYRIPIFNVKSARAAAARGMARLEVFAYPADHAAIIAFTAALVTAREVAGLTHEGVVLAYYPGAKDRRGNDIVPVLPDGPVMTPEEEARLELLADLDRASRAGGAFRPIDLANC